MSSRAASHAEGTDGVLGPTTGDLGTRFGRAATAAEGACAAGRAVPRGAEGVVLSASTTSVPPVWRAVAEAGWVRGPVRDLFTEVKGVPWTTGGSNDAPGPCAALAVAGAPTPTCV